MHVGESTVEIETEADSNDITETADPLHDKLTTGMFGLLWWYILNTYLFFYRMVRVWIAFLLLFLYTNMVIITLIDECKHSQTVM